MKTKVLSLIVVAIFASITLGVGEDPNNPYLCEQEVNEGPFEAMLRIVDIDGNYPGNEIGVEWLEVPDGITIIQTDCNDCLCEPPDICQYYLITSEYLFIGAKTIKRRQYDSAGNSSWCNDIIIAKRLPDTSPPVTAGGCMSIKGGG